MDVQPLVWAAQVLDGEQEAEAVVCDAEQAVQASVGQPQLWVVQVTLGGQLPKAVASEQECD